MSLKAFHIVFVIASVIVAFGFGAWAAGDYRETGNVVNLALGIVSIVIGIALIPYGIWVLRKLKNVSYM